MTWLSRRQALSAAACTAPLAMLSGSLPLLSTNGKHTTHLVHDTTLPAACCFASRAMALGARSIPIEGDRVRLFTKMLDAGPSRIFGVTRHAEYLLFEEVAREYRFAETVLVQHSACSAATVHHDRANLSMPSLVAAAGAFWPEAFADLSQNETTAPPPARRANLSDGAFSWVFARVS
ncbi:hypothetical protein PP1Y_AT11446 [Novosphingobium sp. PP1Y]|nr:hypothetical protein PP1Y_AT11446 [Novosphingobium sp. PP1Y]